MHESLTGKVSTGAGALLRSLLLIVAAIVLFPAPVLWYRGLQDLAKDLDQSTDSAVMLQ
jgi:hypothetical protein